MGSRKDFLKRTLGITEYPWSSGDELEEAPNNTEDTRVRRPPAEPQPSSDAPEPGGSQPNTSAGVPALQPRAAPRDPLQLLNQRQEARRQARHDRELFWSIINSPHRISSVNHPPRRASDARGAARVLPAEDDLWLRVGTSPHAQRMRETLQRIQRIRDNQRIPPVLHRGQQPSPRACPGVGTPAGPSSGITVRRQGRRRPATAGNGIVSCDLTGIGTEVPVGSERTRPRDLALRDTARTTDPPASEMALGETARTSERPRVRAARTGSEGEARRVVRWRGGRLLSPDPQPEPTPPHHTAEDELNNNPSTSVAPEPEPMDESNYDPIYPIVVMGEDLDVEAMESTGANVTLEEEIVAIDLDSTDPGPVEVTSTPVAGPDQTDVRNAADACRNAGSGDASTSSNAANTSGVLWQDHEQRREDRKRRNSNENPEAVSVKEFNQNILRLLECPVCLEWMEPPMSQCRRGHLVCAVCRARLASCPVCRTTFSSVRNRAMEGVAELVRYPCRHGCGAEVRLRKRAPHEASCAARKYACPVPACPAHPMSLHTVQNHFQSQHLTMLKIGCQHKFSIKMNCEQHDNWLIMALDQYFHLKVDVDTRRAQGIVVYVAFIGPKCDAKNYTYEVTIDGQHNQRKLVYARTTHSDLENSSLNVSRHDCFHLTLDQALNFTRVKNRRCDADKVLDVSLQISKVERQVQPLGDSDS